MRIYADLKRILLKWGESKWSLLARALIYGTWPTVKIWRFQCFKMKRSFVSKVTACLGIVLTGAMLLGGCGSAKDDTAVRVGAMSGPTAMSMVKIMEDSAAGNASCNYEFSELATDASAFVAPLTKGELDIACIPSNLASVIYNKTGGAIEVLASCNFGVLNVVEKGESISALSDLAGKTVYMTGQGAVPEYTVRYLVSLVGLDLDNDINVVWCADTTEALSYIKSDEAAVAILPQPFVTAACAQVEGLRVAIDLNAEWDSNVEGCSIITGVVVARKEFAEAHPQVIKDFLKEYENSVIYVNSNPEEATALIEKYGIVAKAAIAQKALPGCNLAYRTGSELKELLSGYLGILYGQNPASVGGNLPGEDFYYDAD